MSCNKGSGSKPSSTISTTDDAADLVTASLSTNATSGSTTNTNDVSASVVAKLSIDSLCGTTWTDSVNRSANSTVGSFAYKATHTYTLDCAKGSNGLADDSVTVNSVFSGNYSYAVLTGSFTGTGVWEIAGLGHGSPTLTINGEYKRSGTFTSKLDTTFAGTHSIDLVLSNVVLFKPLRTIASGTATVTITGNTIKRGAFTYTGTIVFNGQYNATLRLNGNTYLLDLGTGLKRRL